LRVALAALLFTTGSAAREGGARAVLERSISSMISRLVAMVTDPTG